jgi:hypothetical protein
LLASLPLQTFPLPDSGGHAAVEINGVHIVPAAAVILDVNGVRDVIGLAL